MVKGRRVKGTHEEPNQEETHECQAASPPMEKVVGIWQSLAASVPAGFVLTEACPELDISLVGSQLLFKLDVGWELGVVTEQLKRKRSKCLHYVKDATFHVRYKGESGPRESKLTKERYSTSEHAVDGSWAHLKRI